MIDCGEFEYALCGMFNVLDIPELRGFWCDGVILTEDDEHYSKKSVNDRRFVLLDAYIGKSGKGEILYSVKLKFGRKAMSRYQRGLSICECLPDGDMKLGRKAMSSYQRELIIYECLPDGDTKDCLVIDAKHKTLEIQLK